MMAHTTKKIIKSIFRVIKVTPSSNQVHQRASKASQNKDYEIAFVPHAGFKYGDYFNKTYLYENDPDSILYKDKLYYRLGQFRLFYFFQYPVSTAVSHVERIGFGKNHTQSNHRAQRERVHHPPAIRK